MTALTCECGHGRWLHEFGPCGGTLVTLGSHAIKCNCKGFKTAMEKVGDYKCITCGCSVAEIGISCVSCSVKEKAPTTLQGRLYGAAEVEKSRSRRVEDYHDTLHKDLLRVSQALERLAELEAMEKRAKEYLTPVYSESETVWHQSRYKAAQYILTGKEDPR